MKRTEREARIARNEAVFRHVNERIAETAETSVSETSEFVCECDDADCQERVELPLEEYEEVRADGTQFLVADGHENTDFERVLKRRRGYAVVRKLGRRLAALVRRSDPREQSA